MSVDLSKLVTESRNPASSDLDEMSPLQIVRLMNNEDNNVVKGISEVLPQIAQCIQWCADAYNKKGRIIYMGAGTSGRLGLMDAVECPPTFGLKPEEVVGLLAGGPGAFIKAAEGTEDRTELGESDLKDLNLTASDIVIGIAASGRTPYVIGGLQYANSIGCKTVAIATNKNSKIGSIAQLAIEPVCGPEVLTGSTRLKSGTAQKMVLNMISTGTMITVGKVYQNLMVDVLQTNEKLVARAQNIIMEATGCDRPTAEKARTACSGHVKTAIVMILADCDVDQATRRLAKANGFVRAALKQD